MRIVETDNFKKATHAPGGAWDDNTNRGYPSTPPSNVVDILKRKYKKKTKKKLPPRLRKDEEPEEDRIPIETQDF